MTPGGITGTQYTIRQLFVRNIGNRGQQYLLGLTVDNSRQGMIAYTNKQRGGRLP